MNANDVSMFHFPQNPLLRQQWNKQVQKTHADWKDATDNSVLCNEHFISDCFEEDSLIVAQFGLTKRKHLKADAVPMIFHRPALNVAATSQDHHLWPIKELR